jgi:nucleotide-binding universal stress UspA family protein
VAVVPERASEAMFAPIESVVGGIRADDKRVAGYVESLAASLGVTPLVIQASDDGDPAYALERFAATERAGAIVVASRGRGRIARALRGSVTEALARQAARPVVVLPSG